MTKTQIKLGMGKTTNEVAAIYYDYLPKEKAIKYTKELLNKDTKNLLKDGGILYSNTKSTILKLNEKYKLYIVSNCTAGYIEAFLNTSGLKSCFDDYESHGRTGLSKGENIKLLIKRNGLKNAVYVGDTIGDMEGAYFANIPFVYASYGFGNVEKYDYKIKDVKELLNIFDN